jgi:hypothetical protein
MRLVVVSATAIFLAVGGNASAQAAPGPDISHYMVIIATSTPVPIGWPSPRSRA